MSIKQWWKSTTLGTRFFVVVVTFLLMLIGIGMVSAAIDSYQLSRLPAAEQERIRQERARIDAERTRELLQQAAAAREEAQQAAAREAVREAELDEHKANVRACIEAATKLLPGLWVSDDAKGRIEADCAEREARRSEQPGQSN